MLGLRDYVDKNGFPGVVMGLSGGINSALCAAMAADALGPERVHCVMLPYRYTSNESLADAADCAKALGVRYDIVPIAEPVEGFGKALAKMFAGTQARHHRGEHPVAERAARMLMAISNKFGGMVVTTGNKSEMSVGYATLYGDMNGGFNPIKDLYKMEVYRLSRWRNAHVPKGGKGPGRRGDPREHPDAAADRRAAREPDRPGLAAPLRGARRHPGLPGRAGDAARRDRRPRPSARDRADASSACSTSPNTSAGRPRPGVKISARNFGRDRRYPITNKFREEIEVRRVPKAQFVIQFDRALSGTERLRHHLSRSS